MLWRWSLLNRLVSCTHSECQYAFSVCSLLTMGPVTLMVALWPAEIWLPTLVRLPALMVRPLPVLMFDELPDDCSA